MNLTVFNFSSDFFYFIFQGDANSGLDKLRRRKPKSVTPLLLQKGVSENFDFHVTLRHHQSYKLAAEYTF
jgi:hypothetical protein